ncbi:MAG TPA: hypothetical protein VFP93_02525, partial [Gammaproteobacteria bacterium]|nr:hypothetical protein [Gammaproteobacteria bacterium]
MNTRAKIPKPAILHRPIQLEVYKKAQGLNLDVLVSRILAGRSLPLEVDLNAWLYGTLQNIHSPKLMADLQKSTQRLAHAIKSGECIGIETDHDCDGQTSHAVI